MKKRQKEKGVAHLGVIIAAIVVVAAVAFGGWYVWQKNGDKDKPNNSTNTVSSELQGEEGKETAAQEPNYLSLASGDVRLALPEEWPYIKGSSDYCRLNVTSDITCDDGAVITPGAKVATQAGGPDFFGISVGVYENPRRSNAQTWLEQDLDEGLKFETDTTSRAPINGYDTYYWKKSYSGNGTDIEEVYYVFVVDERAVLIYARIYEPRTLDDGTRVGDFRQFESAIDSMARTIKIQ